MPAGCGRSISCAGGANDLQRDPRVPRSTSAITIRGSCRSCLTRLSSFTPKSWRRGFPNLEPREREYRICRDYGAVFVVGIGGPARGRTVPTIMRAGLRRLVDSQPRAHFRGLNGDILLYYPVLDCVFELSSMGIRVDAEAMLRQLATTGDTDRKNLLWHRRLLAASSPCRSGAGSGNRDCACSICAKPTSVRSRPAIGPTTCAAHAARTT